MIQLFGVSKVYPPGRDALIDVNLEIGRGEFVFLSGVSGAGKTTLLKLLFRAEQASAGEVVVAGRKVGRLGRRGVAALRREIGLVFQDFKLLPTLTALDNVALAAEVAGRSSRESRNRAGRLLDELGLADKLDVKPPMLSGGEQQRVAIARSLANNAPLVLADEPTGSLDDETADETMRLFTRINERGTTVVIATHDTRLIERFPYRVALLTSGRLLEVTQLGEEAVL